ncbi:unnamed protein product [Phytophthora fragariaefolia]|uniref:Unnamed protein product n=1 Tax=Phytophthora fragariaefolia TaxID=1490495 RepID=A0A9W7DAB3_9STRA|nr:unnamed protein product [Phytophthora fragariaefolia]
MQEDSRQRRLRTAETVYHVKVSSRESQTIEHDTQSLNTANAVTMVTPGTQRKTANSRIPSPLKRNASWQLASGYSSKQNNMFGINGRSTQRNANKYINFRDLDSDEDIMYQSIIVLSSSGVIVANNEQRHQQLLVVK